MGSAHEIPEALQVGVSGRGGHAARMEEPWERVGNREFRLNQLPNSGARYQPLGTPTPGKEVIGSQTDILLGRELIVSKTGEYGVLAQLPE